MCFFLSAEGPARAEAAAWGWWGSSGGLCRMYAPKVGLWVRIQPSGSELLWIPANLSAVCAVGGCWLPGDSCEAAVGLRYGDLLEILPAR